MARRYTRDNRGRFASSGAGATARGGRLRTAGGNKRATQTMKAKGKPGGTVRKPKGLKPGAIKPKAKASGVEAIPRGDLKRYRMLQNKIQPLRKALDMDGSRMAGSTNQKLADKARASYSQNLNKLQRVTNTMRRLSNSPETPNIPRLPRVASTGPRLGRTAAIRRMDGPRKFGGQSFRELRGQYSDGRVEYDDRYMSKIYKRKNPGDTIKAPKVGGVVRRAAAKPKPAAATGSRTKARAAKAQRSRREGILDRTRRGLYGKNPRVRRQQTGMSQLSLMGRAKPLVRYKRV